MSIRNQLSLATPVPRSSVILEKIKKRFQFNMKRVNALIDSSNLDSLPDEVRDDILRASVVLLHATFEDVLRNVLGLELAFAPSKYLKHISIDGHGKDMKFSVAQLQKHMSKTVAELIAEAVVAHLSIHSFSDTTAVMSNVIEPLRLDSADFKRFLPVIGKMMKRRHKIAHRSDRGDVQLGHHGKCNRLSISDVRPWIAAVDGFVEKLLEKVAIPKTDRYVADDEDWK